MTLVAVVLAVVLLAMVTWHAALSAARPAPRATGAQRAPQRPLRRLTRWELALGLVVAVLMAPGLWRLLT